MHEKSCFPSNDEKWVSKWTCIDDFKAETSTTAEFLAKL